MQGVQLRLFCLEKQRHDGLLLYEWLLSRAREMGIRGGAAFREIAGYGRHDRMHSEFFFELAGDLPVEVMFVTSESEASQLLAAIESQKIVLYYVKSPCEYGYTGQT